jgi:predicted DNA binding CopG/RHH family protein
LAGSNKPYEMRVIADQVEEDEELSEWITRLEDEAERDIAAGTVTLRWGKEQIDVVKRAAGILGVPYQTYLKQVVFRQALADIEQAKAALGSEPRRKPSASVRRPDKPQRTQSK